jgi:virulence factor Mce-like protein
VIGRRTTTNVGVFLALSAFLVWLGATQLVLSGMGGRTLGLDFVDVSGLAPRSDVTMRGVPVGAVRHVELTPEALVHVEVGLDPGMTVPEGTKAEITRRSPIGDLVVELLPGTGPPIPDGGQIGVADTTPPPRPEETIEVLTRVLHAVPSEDLSSLVTELALAVRGRGKDLGSLSETTANLPERILVVRQELESLITNGPKVTGVLAANANTLADDIAQTAALADILRDRRYDLVALSANGADFAEVAGDLIGGQKANLACLIADFGTVNATLAERQHLEDLIATLELNHYFFDGVAQVVQRGNDGLDWFRVQLLPHQEPPGRAYDPQRPPPDVFGANGCRSIYGPGVGPATQPGPVYLAAGSRLYRGT